MNLGAADPSEIGHIAVWAPLVYARTMPNAAGRMIDRIETGVAGLDRILGGGLLRGGLYMVRGAPGSGKTILGNQICYANARRGGKSAFITLLSESHARMMLHLESLAFYDPKFVGQKVDYISGFGALEAGGLRGVLDLLRRELHSKRFNILVIDGLISLGDSSASAVELKRFFQELQLHVDLAACTALLLTGPEAGSSHAANTMADGVIELREEGYELRAFRELHVLKFRGSGHVRGGHFFKITDHGLSVYPRVEAIYGDPSQEDACFNTKISTGIKNLDVLLEGGLPGGTTTMVTGPSGSGKTTLALHYLAATPPKKHAMHFGFYETPPRLLFKAEKLGFGLESRVKRGNLHLVWQASTEQNVDELVQRMLEDIERKKISRLVIDGLDGLQRATLHPERVHHIFTALANELRTRNVTTLYTYEVPKFIGPDLEAPISGVSALVENLIYLRFVEKDSQLFRLLTLLKVRNVAYDTTPRSFRIERTGIEVDATSNAAHAILSRKNQKPVRRQR